MLMLLRYDIDYVVKSIFSYDTRFDEIFNDVDSEYLSSKFTAKKLIENILKIDV